MDRSFLSDTGVIAASRRFVCIRLATYESAAEAEVLTSFFVGRSGELENTTFVLLAPDGKTKLSRAGRSPEFAFRGGPGESAADEMAESMREIATRHEATPEGTKDLAALPVCADVRRALDIAACDGLPLVVVTGADAAARRATAERVAAVAWSAPFVGRFAYVVAGDAAELKPIEGAAASKAGVLVVEPDRFGVAGTLLATAPAGAAADLLAKALSAALAKHRPIAKDTRSQVEAAHRAGIEWKTESPVTDPGVPAPGDPPPPPKGGR